LTPVNELHCLRTLVTAARVGIASISAGPHGIWLPEIPGLLEGVFGVADGNPLLFGAQIFSIGELESGERLGFRQGQCRVGLVIAVEVFFDA